METINPVHTQADRNPPSQASMLTQLQAIERALHDAGLSTPRPSDKAMRSTAPFCFDTLPFHAWLQWLFIPRMAQAVQEATSLPAACSIAPLAAYRFAEMPDTDTDELLALLVAFDERANRYFQIQETNTP